MYTKDKESKPQHASDVELLHRWVENRDGGAFGELERRHRPWVLGLCRKKLRHEQDAEDACQKTFAQLARKAGSIKEPEALLAWLSKVARREAAAVLEKKPPHVELVSPDSLCEERPQSSPEDKLFREEEKQVLDEAINALPWRYQRVIYLHHFADMTTREIAIHLNLPEGTVKSDLKRARHRLKDYLDRRGLGRSAGALAMALTEGTSSTAVQPALAGSTTQAALRLTAKKAAAGATVTPWAWVVGKLWIAPSRRAVLMVLAGLVLAGGVAATGTALIMPNTLSGLGQPLRTIPQPLGVRRVAVDPSGARLAVGLYEGTIKIITETGKGFGTSRNQGHSWGVTSLSFCGDGKLLASGSRDGTVKIWDLSAGREIRSFAGHSAEVLSVAFSLDSRLVASADENGTVLVWDVSTGEVQWRLPGAGRAVVYSPDGGLLATAGAGKALQVWNTRTRRLVRTLPSPGANICSLAFSPDAKRVAAGGADGEVKVWGLSAGKEAITLRQVRRAVNDLSFSADGKYLAAARGASQQPGEIKVWDAATGEEVCTLPQAKKAEGVAFSRNGRLVVASTDRVTVWDMADVLKRRAGR
jgi:RNA polymerase sigma factor (sigma-70 family)